MACLAHPRWMERMDGWIGRRDRGERETHSQGHVWFLQWILRARFLKKKSRMHEVLNEVYLQKNFGMGITFRN